jgi:regulator of sirC expression with transglutaminase-like and TPR domain
MHTIKTELLELLRRNDLLRAALIVGKVENPTFCEKTYVDRVLELAARMWNRSSRVRYDPILKAESINHTLFKEYALQGKSEKYKQVIDDPNRYFLHSVLEKREGCPLSFAILYLIMAEQIGMDCECLALPSYYLIKVKDVTGDFFIDPFDGGKFLKPEDFYRKFRVALQRNRMISANLFEKVTPYQLVARLVQQLKHVYILKGDALTALRAVELLTALFPQSPEITRDRGILYCEMEYFSKAMEDLRYYLQQRPQAEDVSEIKKLTSMLKGYREIMN